MPVDLVLAARQVCYFGRQLAALANHVSVPWLREELDCAAPASLEH
jgi:hypothetical protein